MTEWRVMKEYAKFALALIVCLLLVVLVFAVAIYCRDISEGDAIVPAVGSAFT
jgi:hypothetical protein